MELVYAFTDEYGAFGWDIQNPSVSTHFIITAIIVKESDLASFAQQAEALRKKHFQTGEIKSSKIGKYQKLHPDKPLPHITPHVFCHTFCTSYAQAGLDLKSLQYVMGHSDAGVTLNVYTHANYAHAADQMDKITEFRRKSRSKKETCGADTVKKTAAVG